MSRHVAQDVKIQVCLANFGRITAGGIRDLAHHLVHTKAYDSREFRMVRAVVAPNNIRHTIESPRARRHDPDIRRDLRLI